MEQDINNYGNLCELNDKQLEEAVVATLLIKPGKLHDVVGRLKPDMFRMPDVGFVYAAIREQYGRGETPDFITTETQMRRMDNERTNRIGGIATLDNALVHIRHAGNLEVYTAEIIRRYNLRRLEGVLQKALAESRMNETDPLVLTARLDQQLMEIREDTTIRQECRPIGELALEAIEMIVEKKENGNKDCVMSGLDEFDAIMQGFQPGELVVCAGRPSEGKTAFALFLAIQAAMAGKHTMLYSFEMSPFPLVTRIFAGYTPVAASKLRSMDVSGKDIEVLKEFAGSWKNLPLYINYTPQKTVEEIRSEVLTMRQKGKCDFVISDYLQLMETDAPGLNTQDLYIGQISKTLKQLSIEANIPVLLLSQMNRDCERRPASDHMPKMSDLRHSGAIEQDADTVFFVYNPEKHGKDVDKKTGASLKNVLLMIFRKHRNGKTGTARVRRNDDFSNFGSYNQTLFSVES